MPSRLAATTTAIMRSRGVPTTLHLKLLVSTKSSSISKESCHFSMRRLPLDMVKHGMYMVKKATQFLNPGQIPVTTFDQPLFAIAKQIQWTWPELYGENVYTVMLGGLHTEMALWSALGDILDGSGWTNVLVEAGIAKSGTADSFLSAAHLSRTG